MTNEATVKETYMTGTEIVGNLHMHTPYSDGAAYHPQIAEYAREVGLDFVVVTDHNLLVNGVQGYYGNSDDGYVLLLTGEEIHDRKRIKQNNHCLVYGVSSEMAKYAEDPQQLIDAVNAENGMTFLAHPFDKPIAWMISGGSIEWETWDIHGFTGLEIWNYMSSFKETALSPLATVWSVFYPERTMIGPNREILDKWDELLATGQRVVGIGGSDAHAQQFRIGFLTHTIFPYDFLFRCVNTHLLLQAPLQGIVEADSRAIYHALRQGHAFISYGLVGDARGFRFTAQGMGITAIMGERIQLGTGITLQVVAPLRGRIRLVCHGEVVAEESNVENLSFNARQPGAYRVEIWRIYKRRERCWILSNPIYVH